jgi:hypothetical protein
MSLVGTKRTSGCGRRTSAIGEADLAQARSEI